MPLLNIKLKNRAIEKWKMDKSRLILKSRDDPRHSHSGPPIFEKLWRARSLLYRSRFLRPRSHFAAFFEIYKIYIPSHRSKLNFYCKNRAKIRIKTCWFFEKSTFISNSSFFAMVLMKIHLNFYFFSKCVKNFRDFINFNAFGVGGLRKMVK